MKKILIAFAALMIAACGSTVGGSMGPEEDSATPDVTSDPTLTVTLSRDTPPGMTLPRNVCGVHLATFEFLSGTLPVTMTRLRIHRVGVGAAADFSNLYLIEGPTGERLTAGHGINPATDIVDFNGLSLPQPPVSYDTLMLMGDLEMAMPGDQHAFEIADATAVGVDGAITVLGSFPARGNVFTVGTAFATTVEIERGAQPADAVIGAPDAVISNFTLAASPNPAEVSRVTLQQQGTISESDLEVTGVTTESRSGGAGLWPPHHITLTFEPPLLIPAGVRMSFAIHGRVHGAAVRTIRTWVEYPSDIATRDLTYGSPAEVCVSTLPMGGCAYAGFSGSFDGTGMNFIEVTTR